MATTFEVKPQASLAIQVTPQNTPEWACYHSYRGCRIDATATVPPELRQRYNELWKDAHAYVRSQNAEPKDLRISVVSSFHISYKNAEGTVVSLYEDSIKEKNPTFHRLMRDVRSVAMKTLHICGDPNPEAVCHRPLAPPPFHRFWSDKKHKQLTEKALKKLKKDNPKLFTDQWEPAQKFTDAIRTNLKDALTSAEKEANKDHKKIKQLKALIDTPIDIDSYAILATLRLYELQSKPTQEQEKCRAEIRQEVSKFLFKELESDIKENPSLRSEIENYSWDVYGLGLDRDQYLSHVEKDETEMHGGSLTEFLAYNLLHPTGTGPTEEQTLGMLGMRKGQEASKEVLEALQKARKSLTSKTPQQPAPTPQPTPPPQ